MATGLFTAPMKLKATVGWEWENHWLVYTIAGTLVMPWIIVIATVPEWQTVYGCYAWWESESRWEVAHCFATAAHQGNK